MKKFFTYILGMTMFCCLAVTANAQNGTIEVTDFNAAIEETEFADSLSAAITITYSEGIQLAGSYQILTYQMDGSEREEYERMDETQIEVSGNTISVIPSRLFSTSETYSFVITAGSVTDLTGNPLGSYTNVFLRDTIRPVLVEITPDLNAPVATDAVFTFTFNEDVRLVEDFGFFTYLWDEDTEEFVETERLDETQVTVEDRVLTFDPAEDFPAGERIQIVFNAGSVVDKAGNRYVYVYNNDTVNAVSERFWAAEAGEISEITFTPADRDTLETAPESLTIAFNQDVVVHDTIDVETNGYGSLVYLRQGDVELDFDATFDANVITIVPAEELAMDNVFTFGFTEGFLDAEGADVAAQEAVFVVGDAGPSDEYDAIADIRGVNDESPMDGEEVTVLGTVTGVYPQAGFYVQDANAVRSGIWVEYATTDEFEAGDGVIVSGVVGSTDNGLTIIADEVSVTDAPVTVEPLVVDFENDSIPSYNGVVVSFAGLRASAANEDGDWSLFTENDVDSVLVSSQIYGYDWVADNLYDLTGVVTSRDNIFRVEPRAEADVTDVTDPTSVDPSIAVDINVYPNPFTNFVRISNHERINRVVVSNIAGQRVIDVRNPQAEISTSRLISGVYIINLYKDTELVKSSRIVKQ